MESSESQTQKDFNPASEGRNAARSKFISERIGRRNETIQRRREVPGSLGSS